MECRQGCVNGCCVSSGKCSCAPGWLGDRCDQAAPADLTVQNGWLLEVFNGTAVGGSEPVSSLVTSSNTVLFNGAQPGNEVYSLR